MISSPLIIVNSDVAGSAAGAAFYAAIRQLPINVLTVNLTNADTIIDRNQLEGLSGTPHVVQSFVWNGEPVSAYNGTALTDGALQSIATAYDFDALLLSTHTPIRASDSGDTARVLPAYLARQVATARGLGSSQVVIPNGRIGCPSYPAFPASLELTCRSGQSALAQCVTDAVAAEMRYNRGRRHMFGDRLNATFGHTQARADARRAFAASKEFTDRVVLAESGGDYLDGAGAGSFTNSLYAPPVDLFSIIGEPGGFNLNTYTVGSYPFSENYRVLPGGWLCHWYSFQHALARDWIYNGGCAAFFTATEPLSFSIRDADLVFRAVVDNPRLSLCETLRADIVPTSCPAGPSYSNIPVYPDRQTVIGDPLYRPYGVNTLSRPCTISAEPGPRLGAYN